MGKARYIKNIYQPDEAFGASKFKAGIYLDDENLEKYKKSGIQVGVKEDENGKYVNLSRDEVKMINKSLVYFTPPYIKNKDTSYRISYVDENGNAVRQYSDPNKKPIRNGDVFLIGNGSLVELNVCVFDTKTKGKGHRLEGLRILDLIEYIPQPKGEANPDGGVEQVQEVAVQEPQPVAEKKNKRVPF